MSLDFIARELRAKSILPGPDGKWSIMDFCRIKYGDKELHAIRNASAQADARELQNAKERGELIERVAVIAFCEQLGLVIRQLILSSSMPEEEKEQILVESNKFLDSGYVTDKVCTRLSDSAEG